MTTVTDLTLRSFAVHVPDEDLADLRRRIAAMRWPGKELVPDTSQGVQLYWLTNTATSAARMYWEGARSTAAAAAAGHAPPEVSLPVAFTVFPDEIFQAPRSWAEKVYPNLVYFHQADRGGHFAAWEEPQLFSEELRAAFSSLR